MFNPQYTLTSELLYQVAAIERLYGQLESMQLPRKLQLNLERNNLVQSAYVSNSIEGNPLSLPEVTNLLLGDRVPTSRDEKEVANYFGILKKLPSIVSFDVPTVVSMHKELLTGVDENIAGQIRNSSVVIGRYVEDDGEVKLRVKHNPPYHAAADIERELNELFSWTQTDPSALPILTAGVFHHQYVYLHPFTDGNGRTCRLLTALWLIQSGYEVNKYFVLDDYYDVNRQEYSDALSTADKGDLTQWLTYFTMGVHYSLQSALSKAQQSLATLEIPVRPTPREAELLEHFRIQPQLTSSDAASHLDVSRQAAHKLLNGLVEKGLIEKIGSTKSSYYQRIN